MPMVSRLQTLGRLRLLDKDGNDIAFPQMGLIILAYLKVRGLSSYPRADISTLLWGDADPAQAYANLRKSASRILSRQNDIGLQFLSFSPSTVILGKDAIETDIDCLSIDSSMIDRAFTATLASRLREDFLKDVKPVSKTLAAWIDREREAHLSVLRRCVLATGLTGDDAENRPIKDAAVKLLEHDHTDDAVRNLLRGSMYQKAATTEKAIQEPLRHALVIPEAARPEIRTGLPRLVLLPPLSDGAGPDVSLFASALIEDVTIGLCSLRSLSIIAPYSATKIRDHGDKAATYERYSISYILDTRLTYEGNGYSLFAQLIFFGSDEVVWAERFELNGSGLIKSRRDIALRLAEAISRKIHSNETIRSDYEQDPGVYRSFLHGQSHLMNLDLPEIRRARKHFREALQFNPVFAPAQSGLSRSYFLEWLVTARNDKSLLSMAQGFAEDAIVSDPHLPTGYKELGVAKLYMRQFDESAEFFATAEALSPHYANLIASYGDALIQASRPQEGLEKVEHAIHLNPIAPDEYFWTAAGACYSLGRYEDALTYIGRMNDRAPADRLSAASWGMLGDGRKAGQFVRKTFDVHPAFDLDTWMALVPFKEEWQRQHYKEGLVKAGF
jgi:tetratricopeptide (TPR) repeat protein/DNA-binding SARP family transcriptional activator